VEAILLWISYHFWIISHIQRAIVMTAIKLAHFKEKIYADFTKQESTLPELLLHCAVNGIQVVVLPVAKPLPGYRDQWLEFTLSLCSGVGPRLIGNTVLLQYVC
jgi:hypothetical protein